MVLILLAGFAAFSAYQFSRFSHLRVQNPVRAHAERPDDALALAKVVDKRVAEAQEIRVNDSENMQALRSLVAFPLSRSSLRIIGFGFADAGDQAKAEEAMILSNRVSRRDAWAQLWFIEQAAKVGDYQAAVDHYHAALSVKPRLEDVLIPPLVQTLSEREARQAIRPYLASRAPWSRAFVAHASANADPVDLLDLIGSNEDIFTVEENAQAATTLIYRLAAIGRWDKAMALASRIWSDFGVDEFSAPGVTRASIDERLGSLAWMLAREGGIDSRTMEDGKVEVTMSPLSRGMIIAREFPVRPNSDYRLSQRVNYSGSGAKPRLWWQGECIGEANGNRKLIWEQRLPQDQTIGTYSSEIEADQNCNLLRISILGVGPESQLPATVILSNIGFEPITR
ncbi:hypothetical protein P7228_06605 [Altererythrobacter arenosus]|uniref:Tetratricopeptide repeat protein n=1 Tax=Altererythrobacter arenosus TaxID=3032592 RepID=A0ABY8FUQ4_9SPHN|nr:hypothetical protein [Altererythrobacter sp. CAU 1644]WFL78729.1 hypothetical protein P7228_06605 [Altererythrobacter sp. CAU 1644]